MDKQSDAISASEDKPIVPEPTSPTPVQTLEPRTKSKRITRFQRIESSYSGPIPPPDLLERYEKTSPNAAHRIIAMAENEAKHRHKSELILLTAGVKDQKAERQERRIGQICGTIICFLILAAGTIIAVFGNAPVTGGSIITATLVAIAGIFFYTINDEANKNVNDNNHPAHKPNSGIRKPTQRSERK